MLVNRYCQVTMENPSPAFVDGEGPHRFSSNYYEIAERYLCTPVNQNSVFSASAKKAFPWKWFVWSILAAGCLAAIYYV